MWIGNWLTTGFVDRLFSLLLDKGYHIYLTADHGNVESTGVGRPNQGVIARNARRVRVYRSEPLLADSAAAYPTTVQVGHRWTTHLRTSCPIRRRTNSLCAGGRAGGPMAGCRSKS